MEQIKLAHLPTFSFFFFLPWALPPTPTPQKKTQTKPKNKLNKQTETKGIGMFLLEFWKNIFSSHVKAKLTFGNSFNFAFFF